MKCDL